MRKLKFEEGLAISDLRHNNYASDVGKPLILAAMGCIGDILRVAR